MSESNRLKGGFLEIEAFPKGSSIFDPHEEIVILRIKVSPTTQRVIIVNVSLARA